MRGARWVGPARVAATLAAGVLAIWLAYRLDAGDRARFTLMGLYALVAVGLSLLMGFAGQISLGQGAFYALGAYSAGILVVGLDPDERLDPAAGFDPALAVVIAPFVTAGLAAVIGVPLLRLRGHYLAFATLALHLILLAALFAQDRFTGGQDPGLAVLEPLSFFGWEVSGVLGATPRLTAIVWGAVAVAVVMAVSLVGSRAGRALGAIAASERMAAAAGVNVAAYKLRLFVLSAWLAGLAGALYTFTSPILSPDAFPVLLSIQFVVMVAVGGLGSVYGAVAGALAITWLQDKLRELGAREQLLGRDLPDQAPQVFSVGVFALILIVVILFFPRGLLPALADGVRRLRRRGAAPQQPAVDAAR